MAAAAGAVYVFGGQLGSYSAPGLLSFLLGCFLHSFLLRTSYFASSSVIAKAEAHHLKPCPEAEGMVFTCLNEALIRNLAARQGGQQPAHARDGHLNMVESPSTHTCTRG
jgi:hypothetical protein